MTQEELDARFQTFPREGIGYVKAAVLWKISLKEAILTINDLIKKSKIEYGGTNVNGVFWKLVDVVTKHDCLKKFEEFVCPVCGVTFNKNNYRQKNCSRECYIESQRKKYFGRRVTNENVSILRK